MKIPAKEVTPSALAGRNFCHYRTVGLVCDQIPCHSYSFGSASFIITSIGKTYHIYDVSLCFGYRLDSLLKYFFQADSLNLKFVGPVFDDHISNICVISEFIIVSHGNQISLCRRSVEVGFSLSIREWIRLIL